LALASLLIILLLPQIYSGLGASAGFWSRRISPTGLGQAGQWRVCLAARGLGKVGRVLVPPGLPGRVGPGRLAGLGTAGGDRSQWRHAARVGAVEGHRLSPPQRYTLSVCSPVMSVPLTLLGLLEREPSHGYDLKRDYDAYFGRTRPLPFGQVYATLGRLARDGKVVLGEAKPGAGPDRKRYVITEQGSTEVEAWLTEPVQAEPHLQTLLFVKVVLALMLGRSAERYLDTQRAAHLQRMRELSDIKRTGGVVDALLADHGLFHLEADLRWIDLTAARLDALTERVRS
jgi:DNA-binding PadR family transcriptional regulator